jgi:hypothetical protein
VTSFQITALQDASILAIDDMRDEIQIDPDYQRPGGVWDIKKKQLFVDSLLNRYDIPKLYFHQISGSEESDRHRFAIVDGRQRLETIWSFIDGDFPLEGDFEYLDDPNVKAGGMTYQELSEAYPKLITRLSSRTLMIMVVAADELEFVEDMFSRLNEAVPLNAAEKRNALGGPLPLITRRLVRHRFFSSRLRIPETRYRHHDVAAKFLYLEDNENIVDTKKASLDSFFTDAGGANKTEEDFRETDNAVQEIISAMAETFIENDTLLKSAGMVVVYYVMFSRLRRDRIATIIRRTSLVEFEDLRAHNRELFENDLKGVDRRLIEFDELAQSSNDGAAIRERYEALREYLDL